MDTTLNPVSGAAQLYTPPTAKPAKTDSAPATPTKDKDPSFPEIATGKGELIVPKNDPNQQEEAVRRAALSFKNTYAISDTSFTIFKDKAGTYITRYVSLRDGTVTYLPEPTLIKQVQASTGRSDVPVKVAIQA